MDTAAYEFNTVQAEVKKIAQEVIRHQPLPSALSRSLHSADVLLFLCVGRYHQVPEQILGGRSYHAADVHQWVADVSTQCLKKLKSVANGSAGFKYIVNCSILQKRNAGFHTNSACFWDAERDGSVAIRWENATMTCVLTVYCISLQ